MSSPKYVAYLTQSDPGSNEFLRLFYLLPKNMQDTIGLYNFNDAKKSPGCPKWLRGYPILATNDASPTIWEGLRSIELLKAWIERMSNASSSYVTSDKLAYSNAVENSSTVNNPAELGMNTISQSTTDNGYGANTSVVTADLYMSCMPNKNAAICPAPNEKVSSKDFEEFNRRRDQCPPRAERMGIPS